MRRPHTALFALARYSVQTEHPETGAVTILARESSAARSRKIAREHEGAFVFDLEMNRKLG
jgi:hypothetical protein